MGESSYVARAHRVNGRWIVHHGLDQRAKAYMEHPARVDGRRLERSCQLAHQLTRQAPREDPKPWFYAGLLSLATEEEAKEFLANHWFASRPFRRSQLSSPGHCHRPPYRNEREIRNLFQRLGVPRAQLRAFASCCVARIEP